MPKLWSDTLVTHRHEIRDAIMNAAWALAMQRGPMSLTMSQVASEAEIGRATLYKYFPDVQTILHARHAEHVREHLTRLSDLRDQIEDPRERLGAVAQAYAQICHHRAQHGTLELAALLHPPESIAGPEEQLHDLFEGLVADAVTVGAVRLDIPVGELATYCLHALGAASALPTRQAVERLTTVTLDALRAAD